MAHGYSEMWVVGVMAAEDEHSRVFRMPGSSTMGQVLSRWTTAVSLPGRWALVRQDGALVEEGMCVSEAGEGEVGRKVFLNVVEEAEEDDVVCVRMIVLGREDAGTVPLRVSVSKTPEEVQDAIRRGLGLEEEQVFRLRTEKAALCYSLPLGEQGVVSDCLLLIDLGYTVQMKDVWEKEVEVHLIFSTETLEERLGAEHCHAVYFGAQRVSRSEPLATALPREALARSSLRLHIEYQRQVKVWTSDRITGHAVWPYERLSSVIPASLVSQRFSYEGRVVLPWLTFKQVGVEENGVISQERAVPVLFTNGQADLVWLPHWANGADLTEAVSKHEEEADFVLRCDHRFVEAHHALDASTLSGGLVVVEKAEQDIAVRLDGATVEWQSRGSVLSFSRLMNELVRHSGRRWVDVEGALFCCDGCGRRLRRDQEEEQLVPAACCGVRSLRLTLHIPVIVEDAGVQGRGCVEEEPGPRSMSERTKTLGEKPLCEEVGTQMEEGMRPCLVGVVSIQHPPIEPWTFVIGNFTDSGPFQGKGGEVSLRLCPRPTVKEVRVELARLLEREPEEIAITRLSIVKYGRRLVHALFEGRSVWTSEDGLVMVEEKDVKEEDKRWEILVDDAAPFLLVPERHLGLYADTPTGLRERIAKMSEEFRRRVIRR